VIRSIGLIVNPDCGHGPSKVGGDKAMVDTAPRVWMGGAGVFYMTS